MPALKDLREFFRIWHDRLWPRPRRVQTPTVLQMEAVECGAAALGIILGYYGRIVPLATLRQICGVSRDGSTAANVVKAARQFGLKAKGFKKGLAAIQQLRCPYIVFWNFNHFLVVEGWGRDRVYLNDPGTGPRTVTPEEFDEGYTGVVLVMEPGPEFRTGGQKPGLLPALTARLQGSWGAIAYCLIAGFLLVIPGILVPAFSQIFIDQIIIQDRQSWLRPLLWSMAIVAIVRGVLTWLQLRYLRRLRIKFAVKFASQFLWHVMRLPASFYAQRYAGEIANRFSLNSKVAEILSGRLATTAIDIITMLIYALVMAYYDWLLTAIGILFAAINLLALQQLARQRVDANIRLGLEYGKVAGVAISGLQNIETLKASALETDFFARWSGHYAKAQIAQQVLGLQNSVLITLPTLLTCLATLLLIVIGGLRVIEGDLSVGMLVAFLSLMQSFLEPVNRLVNLGGTLQELEGDLERLDDLLQNPIDPTLVQDHPLIVPTHSPLAHQPATTGLSDLNRLSAPDPLLLFRHKLQGKISLKNVTFGYSPVSPPLIENFDLQVHPGQRIGLVGSSGSGKSTLIKLITGLYQPWSGEICLDDQPLAEIPRSCLTNSLAIVEQDVLLFAGTIRENLTLWDTSIPEAGIVQACQDALIHEVILSLPGGYSAKLREGGTNLSGGQRQRLEIARALVNDPTILLLDEATSALDSETEQQISRNLKRRGCSCIVVAHRLSTVRDCDEIIVFDQGHVVQRGTHGDLVKAQGLYAKLLHSGY